MEDVLTELSRSVNGGRMGRPPIIRDLKVEKTTLWLHRPVVDRIIEIVGKQGLSQFMREAAEKELERREAAVEAEFKRRERKPKGGEG